MPGVYKQKDCPQCGVTHRKRGPYCSQACANKDRIVSDKVRDNMRKVVEEYRKTPEGIAAGKLINSDIAPEDYAVDIPDFPDLPDGYDVADRW